MSIFPVDAALEKELPLFYRQVLISSEIVGSSPIVPQQQGQDSKNTGGVLEAHYPLQGGVDFGIGSAGEAYGLFGVSHCIEKETTI